MINRKFRTVKLTPNEHTLDFKNHMFLGLLADSYPGIQFAETVITAISMSRVIIFPSEGQKDSPPKNYI